MVDNVKEAIEIWKDLIDKQNNKDTSISQPATFHIFSKNGIKSIDTSIFLKPEYYEENHEF